MIEEENVRLFVRVHSLEEGDQEDLVRKLRLRVEQLETVQEETIESMHLFFKRTVAKYE